VGLYNDRVEVIREGFSVLERPPSLLPFSICSAQGTSQSTESLEIISSSDHSGKQFFCSSLFLSTILGHCERD
jgi:hypothetical protein